MKTFLAVLLAFGAGVAVAVFIQKSQKTPTGQSPRPPRPPQPSPPPQSSRPSSLQEKFARVRSSMPVTAQAQDTPSPASAQAEHPGAKWFRQQIMAFADDLLAYYVSQYALEQNLSAVKTMELYQKYGRKPFEPSLQEYEAGFREQGLNLTGLAEIGMAWLKENGVTATSDDWEQKITSFLEKRQKPKAQQIVQEQASA